MSQNEVIEQIKAQKKLPNLKFSIKEKTEAFTNNIFYTLFDEETPEKRILLNWVKILKNWQTLFAGNPKLPAVIFGRNI